MKDYGDGTITLGKREEEQGGNGTRNRENIEHSPHSTFVMATVVPQEGQTQSDRDFFESREKGQICECENFDQLLRFRCWFKFCRQFLYFKVEM